MGKIRKVLAMLLCVAITLSMVPAFAVEVDAVDGDSPLENGVEFLDYPVSVDGEVELMVSEIATSTLFLKYPRYLSNSSMDERLWKVEDECIKVINSYSNSDAFIASLMTALSDGVSVGIGELTAQFGIGDTFYNKNLKKAAEKFLNNMMVNDQTLSSSAKKVSSKFKAIKTAYSAGEAVAKEQILKDLQELSKDRYIHLSTESLDKVVNKCYSDPGISKALKGAGNVISMAQLTIEVVELAELECEELYFLIDELEASGQGDGDLAKGLKLIRADVEKSTFEYMLEKYLDEKVIKLISKMADKLFMAVFDVSSVSFTLATLCGKIFADYIYLGPKADDIIQGASSFSFIYELSIPLSNCRAKFIQGKGTEDDIADYEILYGAYIAAHVTAGNACEDLTKDPYHCYAKAYADDLKYYNYDKYIEWCKEAVINDINNGTLNSGTGDFNIEDTTNEESLRARLAAVYELCPPNNGYIWNKQHHYANGLLGFTSYVFEMLFDKVLNPLSNTSARYELIKNDNIVLQGQLKEGNVTVNNLKTLFADARIGDVIIASGSHRNMYAGTIVAMTDNGPKVYDCNSTYNIEDLARFLVQEYVFTYDKLAAAFNSRGSQKSAAGISIYRAGHKVNTDKSESLYYETYDDSVNYIVENGVLTGYKGSRTTLEIPSNKGITEIAAGCFKNNKSLRSVYVPDTVTVIGEGAFEGCTNLQYAQLSRNLDELSNRMFYGCSSLSATRFSGRRIGDYAYYNCNVHLLDCADSIEEIGEYAFVGNDNLREIIFSDVLRAIGYRAFAGTAIEEVTIPKTVEAMHSLYNGNNFYGAFQNCNSLKTVIFEEGTKKIDDYSFENIAAIETVVLPSGLEEIGYRSFSGTGIKEITIPNTVKTVGMIYNGNTFNGAFQNCSSLKKAVFEEGITKLPEGIFNSSSGVETVIIPDSVTEIGERAFEDAKSLINMTLPKNLKILGYRAFAGTAIKEVTIPKTVETMHSLYNGNNFYGAFQNCNSLKKVIFEEGTKKIDDYSFENVAAIETVVLPSGLEEVGYRSFSGTGIKEITIPNTVKTVGMIYNGNTFNGAFQNCSSLKKAVFEKGITKLPEGIFNSSSGVETVIIPDSVTEIGERAFEDAKSLINMTLPKNLKILGYRAFAGTAIKEVTIPKTVETMHSLYNGNNFYGAFQNCNSLKTVIFEEGTKKIDDYSFENVAAIETVVLPSGLEEVGYRAFSGTGIKEITIPNTVKTVGMIYNGNTFNGAFQNCSSLKKAVFEEGITKLPEGIFNGSSGVETVIIPDSVTEIGERAFEDAKSLINMTLPKNLKILGYRAFAGTAIKEVTIPKTVEAMHSLYNGNNFYGAFQNCNSLKKVIFEEGTKKIDDYSFDGVPAIEEVTVPHTVTDIGNNAFYNCNSLKDVYYGWNEKNWRRITIGRNNYSLTSANIHYTEITVPEVVIDTVAVEGDKVSVALETYNLPKGAEVMVVGYSGNGDCVGLREALNNSATLPANTKTVKVFCWESLASMRPICRVKEKAL